MVTCIFVYSVLWPCLFNKCFHCIQLPEVMVHFIVILIWVVIWEIPGISWNEWWVNNQNTTALKSQNIVTAPLKVSSYCLLALHWRDCTHNKHEPSCRIHFCRFIIYIYILLYIHESWYGKTDVKIFCELNQLFTVLLTQIVKIPVKLQLIQEHIRD